MFALPDSEHMKLMKNDDYKEAYEQYEAKMAEAKERLKPEEYKQLEAENKVGIKATLEELAKDVAAGQVAESYAMAYYGQFGNIETKLLWDWLKKNPNGAQGLYLLKSDAFDGVLAIQEGDEKNLYAVNLSVTMKSEPLKGGELDGFGKLEGKKMKAQDKNEETAVVTIAFDGEKAVAVTTEAFKASGWTGAGVVFDGTYIRQAVKK